LQETGGNLTSTAAEQNVYVNNAPLGSYKPLVVSINLDNMAAGDRIILREYYRNVSGGGWVLYDQETFEDADGGLEASAVATEVRLLPSRFGARVTLIQDLGTFRAFVWEAFVEK
jgi:hypothetical protein